MKFGYVGRNEVLMVLLMCRCLLMLGTKISDKDL